MARPTKTKRLQVLLNGRRVGRLDKSSATGQIEFAYHDSWLEWSKGHVPVSISLPLRSDPYRGAKVENVFENLLPDEARVRKNVAERLGARGTDAFSLLSVIGQDCVGALQFLQDGCPYQAVGPIEGQPLTQAQIAETLRKLHLKPMGMDEDDDFRLSIAGAQDKTAFLKHEGSWQRPLRASATTHIFKPAIGMLANGGDMTDSVQNEFLCLTLCRALGADVANANIGQFEDQSVLIVERFDRIWTPDGRLLRLPQEDFCQALSFPSTQKYQMHGGPSVQSILELLGESDRPIDDRLSFMRAQIIFWLLGATDGHAKNFSIAHSPGGGFALTPLYDVLSLQTLVETGQLSLNKYKLAMSVGENNRYQISRITARYFQYSADCGGLPRGSATELFAGIVERMPEAVELAHSLIDQHVSEELVGSITSGMLSRIDVLEAALSQP